VVKDELLAAYPNLGAELFEAFAKAKRPYLDGGPMTPTHKRVMDITGKDPLPYGVEPNRKMIEAVLQYAREQKILNRSFAMEELFAAGTLDLIG